MLNSDKIVLIGMMGSGKTTLGRLAAAHLRREFVDADSVIEAEAGATIPEIFAASGEMEFRRRELAVIEALLLRPGECIIAAGGGAFCQDETRRRLLAHSLTVFLRVEEPELLRRLEAADVAGRPMLAGDWRRRVADLASARYPVYGCADLVFELGRETPEVSAARLVAFLRDAMNKGEKAC